MIEPIDDELRDFVRAYQEVERPSQRSHATTWAGIDARITAAPAAGLHARLRRPATIAALAAAVALCFGIAAAAVWRGQGARDAEASHHTGPPTPGTVAPGPELRAPVHVDDGGEPAQPRPEASQPAPADTAPQVHAFAGDHATASKPRARRKPRPATDVSLRPEEVASFRRGQAALADDRHEQALLLLDEHGRRYPGGFFEEERQVSRAAALCGLGRAAEARSVREQFLRDRPASHLRERMRQTCREIE